MALSWMHRVIEGLVPFLHTSGLPPRLTTVAERREWESAFSNRLVPQDDPAAVLAEMRARMAIRVNSVGSALRCLLDETGAASGQHDTFQAVFRLTSGRVKSRAHLTRVLDNHPDHARRHPFLSHCLHAPDADLASHLPALVRWAEFIKYMLSRRLSREDAACITEDEFIADAPDGALLRPMYQEFEAAWNAVREARVVTAVMELDGDTIQDTCTQLGPDAFFEMCGETKLISCCLTTRDQGAVLWSIILKLTQLHNGLVNRALELAQQDCKALQAATTLWKGTGGVGQRYFGSKALRNVAAADTASFQWCPEYLQHFQYDLRYGHGQEGAINLSGLEAEVVRDTILGRVNIDVSQVGFFLFDKELQHNVASALRSLEGASFKNLSPMRLSL